MYHYVPNMRPFLPLARAERRARAERETGAEREPPPTALKSSTREAESSGFTKKPFLSKVIPLQILKIYQKYKILENWSGKYDKKWKNSRGFNNIFIFYINNYQKIVWCLLCIDKLRFDTTIYVCSACIRFAHTRLGGRRAMRDVFVPGAMPETMRLSYIFTYLYEMSVCRYEGGFTYRHHRVYIVLRYWVYHWEYDFRICTT